MAKNLQSLPNLFYIYVIWVKPHKTALGGIASFCLRAINTISQGFSNILLVCTRKKMLHCLCTVTSVTHLELWRLIFHIGNPTIVHVRGGGSFFPGVGL